MTTEAHAERSSFIKTLGWAIFLGCSWTWCIGMFLPVLLVRDYGPWAWVVFAVPNVIGAAAMGWVLAKSERLRLITVQHVPACTLFSLVTIAFHVFFMCWVISILLPFGAALVLCAAGGIFFAGRKKLANDLVAGAIVLAISVAAMVMFCSVESPRTFELPMARGNAGDWIGLSLVCIFGFALCPYLDLTFHRAWQALDRARARVAFGVGFGVVFLAMIVFTFLYAETLLDVMMNHRKVSMLAIGAIAIHMIVQSGFTIAIHLRPMPRAGAAFGLACVLAGVMFGGGWLISSYVSMSAGEATYRLFMSFYGVAFPASVWLYALPLKKYGAEAAERALRVWWATVLLAAPMYFMAFMRGRMIWIIPGLLIVLLSRFAVGRGRGSDATIGGSGI